MLVHLVVLLGSSWSAGRWSRCVDRRAADGPQMTGRCASRPLFLDRQPRSARLVERNIFVYRHGWLIILSGFFEPLFYLLGIGFGLGALVGTITGPGRRADHATRLFVAPALLASAAMNGAITESTFNFFFKLNYNKTFTSILATPLSPGDVAARRARLGAHPRRALRHRLPGRDGRPGPGVFAVGDPRGPGGAADRVRVRGRRDGRDVVHEDVAGLRPDPARRPAAVPVLGRRSIPVETYPRGAPVHRPAHAAVPGRGPHPLAVGRRHLADPAGPRRVPRRHGLDRAGRRRAGSTCCCSSSRWPRRIERGAGGADRRDRRLPALPAARRLARAGRAREGRAVPRRAVLGPAGAGLRRPGRRGSCSSGWRRRRTAATGRAGSSPAMRRATSCGRRSTPSGSPTGRSAGAPTTG